LCRKLHFDCNFHQTIWSFDRTRAERLASRREFRFRVIRVEPGRSALCPVTGGNLGNAVVPLCRVRAVANACSPGALELPWPIAEERSTERRRLRQEADRHRRRCRPGTSSSGTCSVLQPGAVPELACSADADSRANQPDVATAKACPEPTTIRTHGLTI